MNTTRAYGYVRVSTEEQATSGLSIDAQIEKIKAQALVKDWDLIDVIIDAGESGKSLHRPGMLRLLELVRNDEVDVMIVTKLDRLSRDISDMNALMQDVFAKADVALCCLDGEIDSTTASGRFVANIRAAMAQFEREIIAERTSDALQLKLANGEKLGQAPLGYRYEHGQQVEDVDERSLLVRARELRNEGLPLHAIAERLTDEGFRTRRGKPIHAMAVSRRLRASDATAPVAA